jgi:predicted DNA-binding protein
MFGRGLRAMIRGKTRHQLFLPDEMSKRLTAMAKNQKRSRSDLLLEMVDAYMNRRSGP